MSASTTAVPVGDRAVRVRADDPPGVAAALRAAALDGVEDVVPAAASVLVIYAAVADPRRRIDAVVRSLVGTNEDDMARASVPTVTLEVRYDGLDLHELAARVGQSVDEVVRRHTAAEYTVAFVGFAPGFAYLTGLDPTLHLPRRADPRTRVPAGSVAVAASMSAVYPRPGPGGWHLLGTTDACLFDTTRQPAALLEAGVRVRFEAR